MGYKFQFVTLAGFHALNYSMFQLARGYRQRQMSAYVALQQEEFAAEERGLHRHEASARSRRWLLRQRDASHHCGHFFDGCAQGLDGRGAVHDPTPASSGLTRGESPPSGSPLPNNPLAAGPLPPSGFASHSAAPLAAECSFGQERLFSS